PRSAGRSAGRSGARGARRAREDPPLRSLDAPFDSSAKRFANQGLDGGVGLSVARRQAIARGGDALLGLFLRAAEEHERIDRIAKERLIRGPGRFAARSAG